MLYKITLGLVATLIFNACGGGGSTENTHEINNIPVAIIETLSSQMEGSSVELNASKSYDGDHDVLTFAWKQSSGEELVIINADTAHPSFISPNVDEDSIVELELSLSDGKDTRKAKISINIINIKKEEKRHEVFADKNFIESSKGIVKITYFYNKIPVEVLTSGLSLNIYWDSSVLEIKRITEKISTDFIGLSIIKEDKDNKDNNKYTDKYISISWLNLEEGKWKIPNTLPTALFELEMKEINSPSGTTVININTQINSPNLSFYGSSMLLSLGK